MMQFQDSIEAEEHLIRLGFKKLKPKKKTKRLLYEDNVGNIMEIKKDQVFFDVKL